MSGNDLADVATSSAVERGHLVRLSAKHETGLNWIGLGAERAGHAGGQDVRAPSLTLRGGRRATLRRCRAMHAADGNQGAGFGWGLGEVREFFGVGLQVFE